MMTREAGMPDQDDLEQLRLQDDRVESSTMLHALPPEEGLEGQPDLRELETQSGPSGEIDQLDALASLQEARKLLVHRSALVEAFIEVLRQKREARLPPPLVTRARELPPRRPITGNRSQPCERRTVLP